MNTNDEVLKDSPEENIPQDPMDSETQDTSTEGTDAIQTLKETLANKVKESQEYLELARRTMAEFDNFRKRTQKEKESLYNDGFSEAVTNLLPVLDNLERAVNFNKLERNSFTEGVDMVLKIFKDTLNKMGVEEIEDVGKKFDPDYHNAVMHIEDESLEENIVVEVLQKGYKYKNKVIRHSMVKVAN